MSNVGEGGVEARLQFLELSCVGGRGRGAFRFGRGRFGELLDGGGADIVGFGSEVGDGGALVNYFAACFFNLKLLKCKREILWRYYVAWEV